MFPPSVLTEVGLPRLCKRGDLDEHAADRFSSRRGSRRSTTSALVGRSVFVDWHFQGLSDHLCRGISKRHFASLDGSDRRRAQTNQASQFGLRQSSQNPPVSRETSFGRHVDNILDRPSEYVRQLSEQINLRADRADLPVLDRPLTDPREASGVSTADAGLLAQTNQLCWLKPAQHASTHSLSSRRALAMSRHCAATPLVSSSNASMPRVNTSGYYIAGIDCGEGTATTYRRGSPGRK